MYVYSLVQIFLNIFIIVKLIILGFINKNIYILFINSLISINFFKFFLIIKIVDLGFINMKFYVFTMF